MNATRPRYLVLAAVLAGAGALALVAAGWWIVGWEYRGDWGRYADASWWGGLVLRSLGFLAFGKAGFKIALACVVGTVAAVSWLRTRRRPRTLPPGTGEPVRDE
jgi:hypothetical protein